jgi:hypothetical protein
MRCAGTFCNAQPHQWAGIRLALAVAITRPFLSQPAIFLPVNGSNFRWGRQ